MAALAGFSSGLALDVAPPAAHHAGEYALVFCLVCYGASRGYQALTSHTGHRQQAAALTIAAIAVAAGEAGKAALGMLLSEPDVTGAAVARLLPTAILYDLLLSPLAYLLVARIASFAKPAAGPEIRVESAGVFRPASAARSVGGFEGAAPRLRLAGTGTDYSAPSMPRRTPDLKLSGTGTDYVARRLAGRRRKLNFGGDLELRGIGAGAPAAASPGRNWLRGTASPALTGPRPPAGPARLRFGRLRFGRLRFGRPRRQPAGLGAVRGGGLSGHLPVARAGGLAPRFSRDKAGGPGRLGRPGVVVSVPRPRRTAAEVLAARTAPSGLSALAGPDTLNARRGAPRIGRAGMGRRAARRPVPLNPRAGWIGRKHRPRTVIGSAGRARPGTYVSVPTRAWARRSRNPWRRRGRRLLEMMGVSL
jgi:hypothetical protein